MSSLLSLEVKSLSEKSISPERDAGSDDDARYVRGFYRLEAFAQRLAEIVAGMGVGI